MENDFEQTTGDEDADGADTVEQLGEPTQAGPELTGGDASPLGGATRWDVSEPVPTGQIEPTPLVPPAEPRPFDTPAGWSPSTQAWRPPSEPSGFGAQDEFGGGGTFPTQQPFGYPSAAEPTYWRPTDTPAPGPFGEPATQQFGPQPGGPQFGPQPGALQFGGQLPPDVSSSSFEAAPSQPKTKITSHKVLVGTLIGLLMLALVGAGIGVGLAVRGNHATNDSSGSTASQTIPKPATNSGSTKGDLTIQQVVSKVEPGVVDITSIIASEDEEEAGTGMILTSNGEVLTNNHVIAEATKITAQIDGQGRAYQVKVLGADPTQDVALLQLVGASGLKTVQVGNSSSVQVGESVVAIGNALDLQGSPTVTAGIISAVNRSITASDAGNTVAAEHLVGLLQTSAQINPGNSGGPLANYDGQVIGMNTAADNGSSSQAANSIGFAIPINEALSIAQQIQQGHGSSKIDLAHGFLGVEVLTISQAESGADLQQLPTPAVSSGAYVVEALPGDPADAAGITEGSVITAIDGSAVSGPTQLGELLGKFGVGKSVTVKWVDTSGATHSSSITLAGGPLP